MTRLITLGSYLLVIALTVVFVMALRGPKNACVIGPLHSLYGNGKCAPVIISEFGDRKLYLDKVCSDEDLARIYGQQELREQMWTDEHDCDVEDDDATVLRKMGYGR